MTIRKHAKSFRGSKTNTVQFCLFLDPAPCVLLVHNHPHLTLLVFQYATAANALALEVSFHPWQQQGSSGWHNSQHEVCKIETTSEVDKQQKKASQSAIFLTIKIFICSASCCASLLPVSNGASENPLPILQGTCTSDLFKTFDKSGACSQCHQWIQMDLRCFLTSS